MNRVTDVKENPGRWPQLLRHIPPSQLGRYLVVGIVNTAFAYGSYALLTLVLLRYIPFGYLPAALISSLLNSNPAP